MPFDITPRLEAWRTQLLDTTKRNPLINFKAGRSGGLPLVYPDLGDLWHRLVNVSAPLTFVRKRDLIDLPPEPEENREVTLTLFDAATPEPTTGPEVLQRCLHSPHLRTDHLLTELADRKLAGHLTRLVLRSRESLTEQGVATLFVAFGFLRWFESDDSQVEIRAPLLLLPVRLERANVKSPWRLLPEDEDIIPNHTLAQLLVENFKLKLPLLEDSATDTDTPNWYTQYFGKVAQTVRAQQRWEVMDEAALGTFRFQKLAMWDDLDRNRNRVVAHGLCRAIAGDPGVTLCYSAKIPTGAELDQKTHPRETFHILDADSSQQEAIVAAKSGASLVLDGPPGTGKSQTIANIIAEFLAVGKTVLFVSEKAAALEVVQRRLQERGLGDFCLACHSHKANKREVVAELGRCLGLGGEVLRDPTPELQRLYETRRQLNDYVRELHTLRSPLGMTVFQVHGELARLAELASVSRCPVPQVLERDTAFLRQVVEVLDRLPDCRGVLATRDRHPWRGCRALVCSATLLDEVRHHFGYLADRLKQLAEASAILQQTSFCGSSPTLTECRNAVEVARSVLECPQVPADWLTGDCRSTAQAVVQLDCLTQAYRQQRTTLPEFAPEALRQVESAAATTRAVELTKDSPLLSRPMDSVRTMPARLLVVKEAMLELARRAFAVEQTTRHIAELLQCSRHAERDDVVTRSVTTTLREDYTKQPVQTLPRLAELAKHMAQMEPVRRGWWDVGRRQELQAILVRGQEESQAAQQTRAQLAVRLSLRAFAPEAAPLVAEASRYRSFWARLWPQWWSLKTQVSSWYPSQVPATTLIADLEALAAFHRRVDYCQQIQTQYAADLLTMEPGNPDWSGTLRALQDLDRLEQLTQDSTPLRAVLSTTSQLDRPALATAADLLAQQVAALHTQLETVAQEYLLTEVADGVPTHVRVSSGDLAAWANRQADAVTRRAALLESLSGLLVAGCNVATVDLPAKLHTVAELAKIRTSLGAVCAIIWPGAPVQAVEEQNWSELRTMADTLLRFLNRWQGPVPVAVVRALPSPEIRARLAEAVRQSDAAQVDSFDESWKFLTQLFDVTQEISTGITIDTAALADLRRWLTDRVDDVSRLYEWTKFCEVEREVQRAGVVPILSEVLGSQVQVEEVSAAFRARFFRLWLDAIYEQTPTLRQFGTADHERLIERFQELDRGAIASAAVRIRVGQLSRPERPRLLAGNPPGSSELGTLLREVNKKCRHLPLRRLFAALPSLLPRLKPCLMMSPLSVSTYLESPDFQFDLVIFDEASQVRPHDAICAIYRGRQLLVAGDQKQLPPTSFFDRAQEESAAEDDNSLENYESVLDVCCTLGLPRRRLRWHYRSRREGLIAFANRFIYGNELITFPSVHDTQDNPAVTWEYVADGRWQPGASGGFNAIEARRTAELVLAQVREFPTQSLGVIAFSQRQQMRILDELEHLREDYPELEEFFADGRDEPFFVKNLENVQGDERDVIFLGVGYGPDATGRVAMRFGPLNQQGGERRLNVAVTRARQRMTVISSLRAGDIDLSRTGALGAKLLRAYLDYAERGTAALTGTISGAGEHGFDSPFEQAVFEELGRQGLTVHPQVGCSSFRVDLAVVDPREPGRYLLGVECDGATYHSSATARDRDRLRQQVLEGLGWRVCRIWSTDWLRDRAAQVQRVQAAVAQAQREPVVPSTPPAPPPETKREQPSAVPQTNVVPTQPSYPSIDAVPEPALGEVLCGLLRTCGAMEDGDLIQAATRQLGFKRTGPRIRDRMEKCLEELIQTGRVCCGADRRVQLASTSQAVSG